MARPYGSQNQLENRRRRAVGLLKSGWSAVAVSRKIGCARSAVYAWWTAFHHQGDDGLKAKPVPGRPPRLNRRQKQKLIEILSRGALNCGYSTELWTTRRVADVVKKRFGIHYHPNHVWRLLDSLGWSCQKPKKRARERDEAAIRHWKRYRWPHIKKSQNA